VCRICGGVKGGRGTPAEIYATANSPTKKIKNIQMKYVSFGVENLI
jgi:hypothetical protein